MLLCSVVALSTICCSSNGTVIRVKDGDLKSAMAEAQQLLKDDPTQKITVMLKPGIYNYDETIVLDSNFIADAQTPLVVKVDGKGKAIFNGGAKINLKESAVVTDKDAISRLGQGCEGNVYSVKIEDKSIGELLSGEMVKISYDGQMMMMSTFPNIGFAHVDTISNIGAIYAHGRTFGDPPAYSLSNPIGGEVKMLGKDVSRWTKEMESVKKALLSGYLAHDCYRETFHIASIDDSVIKLMEYSRYGVADIQAIPRRVKIINLMCELDSAGEFYFEDATQTLYFWPLDEPKADDEFAIWSGKKFIEAKGAENIRFENIIVECVASCDAAVDIQDCKNVELAGCVIRYCSTLACSIKGGENCGLRSCDIHDVDKHVFIGGGNTLQLISSENYAINCHFTQTQHSFNGDIQLAGVGQIFRNNVAHNIRGQIMSMAGNNHQIEKNEFFNIGIEEGDGGIIYSGSSMLSWGNVVRNNFLHHLMTLPQAHPRGGIYPDDGDQGDSIVGNIFYKAAHRAVLINGGGGHTVKSNVFLKGHIGIYNTETNAQNSYDAIAKYEDGTLKRGDKGDIIWRTEQIIGKEGWNNEIWKKRYPIFAKIMNQPKRRFWPIEMDIADNCFCENFRNTQFNMWDEAGRIVGRDFEDVDYIKTANNREITMDVFKDVETLDLNYKNVEEAKDLPNVNFDQIGLYADEYRTYAPNKKIYRAKIKEHFKGRKSFDENAKYDLETVSDMLYFNTGALLLNMTE